MPSTRHQDTWLPMLPPDIAMAEGWLMGQDTEDHRITDMAVPTTCTEDTETMQVTEDIKAITIPMEPARQCPTDMERPTPKPSHSSKSLLMGRTKQPSRPHA